MRSKNSARSARLARPGAWMALPAMWTLLLVLGAATARATTYLDSGFGTPLGAASARALAVGSTGISLRTGSEALFLNPATLAPESLHVTLDLNLGVTQANEDRLVALFDSFDSFLDETAVAFNRNTYGTVSGGLAWKLPSDSPMSLGIGVFDRYDFDYDYFEEFRNPDGTSPTRDELLQNRELSIGGRLRSLSAGYSSGVFPKVTLGATLHRYFGDIERDRRVQDFVADTHEETLEQQALDGWGWSVGGFGHAGPRVDLGASFEGPFTVDGTRTVVHKGATAGAPDTTTAANAEVKYPGTLRFGGTYYPRNLLRTSFSIEMERRFWKQIDSRVAGVFGDSLNVRDTWELRVGLEHILYNGLPMRFGFRYLQNYADPESERSIFSAGIGYKIAGFALDVTGLYHRQTSRQDFLFDPSYLTFQAPDTLAKVEDSIVQLVLGVSRSF